QGPDAGGAHGDHAPARRAGGQHLLYGLARHGVMLGVHDVLAEILDAHRLEGARAHVQGDECLGDALCRQTGEHVLVEMQAGSRRRDGAWLAGIDGLIALVIFRLCGMLNIGRQRRGPVTVQEIQHAFGKSQLEELSLTSSHYGDEGVGKYQLAPRTWRLAGLDMRQRGVGAGNPLYQDLDPASGFLVAPQPGLDDAGIIEDQQIALAQQRGQVDELPRSEERRVGTAVRPVWMRWLWVRR